MSARLFASESFESESFSLDSFGCDTSAASKSGSIAGFSKAEQKGQNELTTTEILMFKLADKLELLSNNQTKLLKRLDKSDTVQVKSSKNRERRLFGNIFRNKLIEKFGEKFLISNTLEYFEKNMPTIYKSIIG
jgi:hypothetical protein